MCLCWAHMLPDGRRESMHGQSWQVEGQAEHVKGAHNRAALE